MDWKVGEKHGGFELITLTPSTATFKMPDGSTKEYPNIFVENKGKNPHASEPIVHKVRKNSKPSEDSLLKELEAAKAKLAALKKMKR